MLMTNPNAPCIGISNLKGAKFVVFAEVEIVCVSPSSKSTFGTGVFNFCICFWLHFTLAKMCPKLE